MRSYRPAAAVCPAFMGREPNPVYLESYERMQQIVQPGRVVGECVQGGISLNAWKKFSSAVEKLGGDPIRSLEAVFQNNQAGSMQQIAVPNITNLLEVLGSEKPYLNKGVSYNPYTATFGENINLLDFYGYLKRGGFDGIILNDAPYAVVNYKMSLPAEKYSKSAAKEAVQNLSDWFRNSGEIFSSSALRASYLEAIALALFPQKKKPIVVDAYMMWQSPRYRKALQESIEFCTQCRKEGEPLQIRRYANYNRYDTDFQRWYSVLVVAESIYLRDVFGSNINLGPTTESNFVKLVRSSMADRSSAYGYIWYDRSVENLVPITARVSFYDTRPQIEEKMARDPVGKQWLGELIAPFASFKSDGELVDETARIVREVRTAADKITVLPPLVEGGFFRQFPPGECD